MPIDALRVMVSCHEIKLFSGKDKNNKNVGDPLDKVMMHLRHWKLLKQNIITHNNDENNQNDDSIIKIMKKYSIESRFKRVASIALHKKEDSNAYCVVQKGAPKIIQNMLNQR